MPTRFEFFEAYDLLLVRHEGRMTSEDQRKSLGSLEANPDFHFGMKLLLDASAVTSSESGFSDLLARRDVHRSQMSNLTSPTQWAYFAPTELSFGLCRRVQILFADIPNLEIGVFRNAEDTLEFLGLALDALPNWPGPSA